MCQNSSMLLAFLKLLSVVSAFSHSGLLLGRIESMGIKMHHPQYFLGLVSF